MDNLPFKTWEYQEQTKIKHLVLSGYLDKWFTIVGRYHALTYIDGFSGVGAYKDGAGKIHFGSPVLAIENYETVHKLRGKIINFVFIDEDKEKLANIKNILDNRGYKTLPRFEHGDFDSIINNFLDKTNLSPAFILIDPFGFKDVKIETIKRLMSHQKTEVLLNFMFTRINEFLSYKNVEEIFNAYFGPCDWQRLTSLAGFEREKALMSLYRNQLKTYAEVRYVYPYPIEFPNRNRTYYYLFHLTNHRLGCSIMKSVFAELNFNRLVYLGNRSNQLSFSDLNSIKEDDIKGYLVDKYKRSKLTYNQLVQNEIDEIPYTEKEIKRAIKSMEDDNVSIKRVTSKTTRGLQGIDVINFY